MTKLPMYSVSFTGYVVARLLVCRQSRTWYGTAGKLQVQSTASEDGVIPHRVWKNTRALNENKNEQFRSLIIEKEWARILVLRQDPGSDWFFHIPEDVPEQWCFFSLKQADAMLHFGLQRWVFIDMVKCYLGCARKKRTRGTHLL